MKYGLLYYKETGNLGDDVQTYAALRFLPRVDYLLDREGLDTFVPETKEHVAVIMNAWYLTRKFCWPPSPYIYPHLVSMHFSLYDPITKVDFPQLKGYGLEYLKKHGNIGCRDDYTIDVLKERDVECYFTGCLTLTINKISNIKKEDYILLVDVDDEVENYIRRNTTKKIVTFTNFLEEKKHVKLSWKQRQKKVEEYLTMIQKASVVITRRLHCALPSLAVETPILLIDVKRHDRLGTYLKYLHNTTVEKFVNGKCDYDFNNPPENKKEYLKIRKNLEDSCQKFIDNLPDNMDVSTLPEVEWYNDFAERSDFQKQVLLEYVDDLKKYVSVLEKNCDELTASLNRPLHKKIIGKIKQPLRKIKNKLKKESK